MPKKVNLEQLEHLVAQMEPSDQLKLAAHICEQLSLKGGEGQDRKEEIATLEQWLADCDVVAKGIKGKFDSAKDLREIREEGIENERTVRRCKRHR